MFDRIKEAVYQVVKSRLFVIIIVFSIMSAILIERVFYLQIVKGQDYLDNYKLQIQKTREISGTSSVVLVSFLILVEIMFLRRIMKRPV